MHAAYCTAHLPSSMYSATGCKAACKCAAHHISNFCLCMTSTAHIMQSGQQFLSTDGRQQSCSSICDSTLGAKRVTCQDCNRMCSAACKGGFGIVTSVSLRLWHRGTQLSRVSDTSTLSAKQVLCQEYNRVRSASCKGGLALSLLSACTYSTEVFSSAEFQTQADMPSFQCSFFMRSGCGLRASTVP